MMERSSNNILLSQTLSDGVLVDRKSIVSRSGSKLVVLGPEASFGSRKETYQALS